MGDDGRPTLRTYRRRVMAYHPLTCPLCGRSIKTRSGAEYHLLRGHALSCRQRSELMAQMRFAVGWPTGLAWKGTK